jgi:arsenite methyltransferase
MEVKIQIACPPGRPGGYVLTDRAISLGQFEPGARILDVGCGSGATVEYLRKKHGFDPAGVDCDSGLLCANPGLFVAMAEHLPFPAGSMDGILMECSFSVVEDQEKVLEECYRVLKPSGRLILTDMYARGEPARLKGHLGRIDAKEDILALIRKHHFDVEIFEDHSPLLKTRWGQMILDHGEEYFCSVLGVTFEDLTRIRCGYFLVIAVKTGEN